MLKLILFIFCSLIISIHAQHFYHEKIYKTQIITRPRIFKINIFPTLDERLKNGKFNKLGSKHSSYETFTNEGNKYIASNNPQNGFHHLDTKLLNKY
jgi:hypothetical protein